MYICTYAGIYIHAFVHQQLSALVYLHVFVRERAPLYMQLIQTHAHNT